MPAETILTLLKGEELFWRGRDRCAAATLARIAPTR
jgi:hypothetical protein